MGCALGKFCVAAMKHLYQKKVGGKGLFKLTVQDQGKSGK